MSAFLRKYGTGTGADIIVPVIKAGSNDFATSGDWTPAAGDVKVSKDGGASANIGTLPTFIAGVGWKFVFSNAELTCARLNVNIVDSATKAIEDQHIVIDTYGNDAAQHAFDLDLAALEKRDIANALADTDITLTLQAVQDGSILDFLFPKIASGFDEANGVESQEYEVVAGNSSFPTGLRFSVIFTDLEAANDDNPHRHGWEFLGSRIIAKEDDTRYGIWEIIGGYCVNNAIPAIVTKTKFGVCAHMADADWIKDNSNGGFWNGQVDDEDETDRSEGGWTFIVKSLNGIAFPDSGDDLEIRTVAGGFNDLSYAMHKTVGKTGYNLTTDSLEAIRDRGDAAWVTGSSTGLSSLATGTAQAGAASSITLAAGANANDDFYKGERILTTGGTGAGQARIITDYNGTSKVATIWPNWTTNPDATTTYEIQASDADVGAFGSNSIDGNNATVQLKQLEIENDSGTALIARSLDGHGFLAEASGIGHGIYGLAGCLGSGVKVEGGENSPGALIKAGVGGDNGITVLGEGSGHGVQVTGGETGDGVNVRGGSTSGSGVDVAAVGGGFGSKTTGIGAFAGIYSIGGDSNGAGMQLAGGDGGDAPGLHSIGGCSGGPGVKAEANLNNSDGAIFIGNGTGRDINAKELGAPTDLDGSGASLAGNTTDIFNKLGSGVYVDWLNATARGQVQEDSQTGAEAAIQAEEPIDVNLIQIDGLATNGNNATLNLKQLNIQNDDGSAFVAKATSGNNYGMEVNGSGSRAGAFIEGGETGAGVKVFGGSTSGNAVEAIAGCLGDGILAMGGGNGDGANFIGDGSGQDINAKEIGTPQNLDGSGASLAGNTKDIYDNLPTAGAIADQVWDEARTDHQAAGSFGEGVYVESLNATARGQVNTEMVDVVSIDTIAELAAAKPPTNPTLYQAIMLQYMAIRNESTETATLQQIKNDAGTVITKKTMNDDGTTFTSGELAAP